MKRPDFFIVGAPRCGTTALNTYLRQHPQIFMGEKESHFFATDLNAAHFIKYKEKYLSLFYGAKNEERIGEASVMYLYSTDAASNIKELCPEASIIIMLRNPVDMLYSLHRHYLHAGGEDIVDFEMALNAETDRKRGLRIPKGARMADALFYRDIVKFAQQVKKYLDIFGRENVWVIVYDEFKKDTAKVYKETLKFLGINDDFQPRFQVINPNQNVRSYTLQRLLGNEHIRSRIGNVMPSSLFIGFERILKRLNTYRGARPPMTMDLRRCLQAEFAPEVERLARLLGKDLTCWNKS